MQGSWPNCLPGHREFSRFSRWPVRPWAHPLILNTQTITVLKSAQPLLLNNVIYSLMVFGQWSSCPQTLLFWTTVTHKLTHTRNPFTFQNNTTLNTNISPPILILSKNTWITLIFFTFLLSFNSQKQACWELEYALTHSVNVCIYVCTYIHIYMGTSMSNIYSIKDQTLWILDLSLSSFLNIFVCINI